MTKTPNIIDKYVNSLNDTRKKNKNKLHNNIIITF